MPVPIPAWNGEVQYIVGDLWRPKTGIRVT